MSRLVWGLVAALALALCLLMLTTPDGAPAQAVGSVVAAMLAW